MNSQLITHNQMPENEPKQKVKVKRKANFTMQNIFRLRIPLAEQVLFTKHLSMMLSAGISEVESLKIIKDQTNNRVFKKMLDKVIGNVERGQFLSESLRESQNAFGPLFINVVKLGEISGTLPENLEYLAEEIKKSQDLRSKIKAALIYPAIVLLLTAAVITSLIVFVLPKITPIFTSLNVELPLTTRILIGTANLFQYHYIPLIVGLITVIGLFIGLLRIGAVRYALNRLLLAMPVAGKMVTDYNMSNIGRTLGLLLKSGVEIVEAVSSTAESTQNPVYKRLLLDAVEEVKQGKTIHTYLETKPKLFPPTFSRMVQIGERTGNLTHNLSYLSGFYESQLGDKVKNLSSVFEPALMIILGLVVGFVALSIITPIYEITTKIK